MTKAQIKELYPDIYNEIYQEGADSVGEEQGRRNEAKNQELYEQWLAEHSSEDNISDMYQEEECGRCGTLYTSSKGYHEDCTEDQ